MLGALRGFLVSAEGANWRLPPSARQPGSGLHRSPSWGGKEPLPGVELTFMKRASSISWVSARDILFLLFNLAGVAVYLVAAVPSWGDPAFPGANGAGPFIWFFGAFPVLLAFFVLDSVWLAGRAFVIFRSREWARLYTGGVLMVLWVLASLFDFSHHYL